MKIYQILSTTNDRNGNPRRLTVVYAGPNEEYHGHMVEVIEHGYSGDHTPEGAFQIPSVDITTKEYASTKDYAKTCSFCAYTLNN
jgi:hypothetical protein